MVSEDKSVQFNTIEVVFDNAPQQNVSRARSLSQYYQIIEKRPFFHYKQLDAAQEHACSRLIDLLSDDLEKLTELYYITAQTPALRNEIIRRLAAIYVRERGEE